MLLTASLAEEATGVSDLTVAAAGGLLRFVHTGYQYNLLLCALAAAQCIVIGPVREWLCVCMCGWVCYHDNSKLRASILTKLGL